MAMSLYLDTLSISTNVYAKNSSRMLNFGLCRGGFYSYDCFDYVEYADHAAITSAGTTSSPLVQSAAARYMSSLVLLMD